MPSPQQQFTDHLVDLLQSMGPVYSKRMFGGYGIFLESLMFGLVSDTTFYLKVDETIKNDFVELGLQPFSYQKKDKSVNLSYYQCPEEAIEDPGLMNLWGNKAYGAAIRAAQKNTKNKKNNKKK